MFDEKFVKELPDDILKAQLIICEHFRTVFGTFKTTTEQENCCLRAIAFVQVFVGIHSLDLKVPNFDISASEANNIQRTRVFFRDWKSTVKAKLKILQRADTYETAKDYYASMFGKGVFYEFSDDDFSRVQTILNNLRDLLTKSEDFEEDLRMRLLKKLEALQSELHKKMSNFDRFWGFFIDSGIALTKFWENAKPFRDDVKEVIQIVSRTQAKAENVQKLFPLNLLKSGDDPEPESDTE
jgi:hypothetical protein